MRKSDYDHDKHECKKCGNLMPFTQRDLENHSENECKRIAFYREIREMSTKKEK